MKCTSPFCQCDGICKQLNVYRGSIPTGHNPFCDAIREFMNGNPERQPSQSEAIAFEEGWKAAILKHRESC